MGREQKFARFVVLDSVGWGAARSLAKEVLSLWLLSCTDLPLSNRAQQSSVLVRRMWLEIATSETYCCRSCTC